jgi:hypothetical protein
MELLFIRAVIFPLKNFDFLGCNFVNDKLEYKIFLGNNVRFRKHSKEVFEDTVKWGNSGLEG